MTDDICRRAIRCSKVQRMIELVRKQQKLEDKIDACHSGLEQAFFATAQQLQIAIDSRVEELVG